jgi:hypothetical protein
MFQQRNSLNSTSVSRVVDHSTDNPMIEGSHPATVAGRDIEKGDGGTKTAGDQCYKTSYDCKL